MVGLEYVGTVTGLGVEVVVREDFSELDFIGLMLLLSSSLSGSTAATLLETSRMSGAGVTEEEEVEGI